MIIVKVTFFWNIGYSPFVLLPLAVLFGFSILLFIFELVNIAIDYPDYMKKYRNYIAPANLQPISSEQLDNKLQKLRRKDLSNFFQVFFAFPILINLVAYLSEKSISSGNEIMSNGILACIFWIVMDIFHSLTTKLIRSIHNHMFQIARRSS